MSHQPTNILNFRFHFLFAATMSRLGVAQEGQLVARPPIHPASFDSLQSNRLDDIFLYYEDQPAELSYRYKLSVLDRSIVVLPTTQLAYATAVFLIPAGRESEFMFSSAAGLQQIAESAQTARLIAVSFGRRHEFCTQETVQQELAFAVQVLSRQGLFLPKSHAALREQTNIPFLAMDGIGQRNVIAEGESALSGRYLVEQVKAGGGLTVRRLYFMDNPFVIQSEVALLSTDLEKVDTSHAAFEYHKQMAAGVLALTAVDSTKSTTVVSGLMVGLGGGGLVNFLRYLLPETRHNLTAIELDPTVVQVAQQYFGVVLNDTNANVDHPFAGVTVRVGDGLCICADTDETACMLPGAILFPEESLSFLAIDVDSKDKSVGMACPPVSFVEPEYLEQISKLLQPNGVLAVNVSARDPSMLELACRNVKAIFPTVIVCKQEDQEEERKDVNVVLFALRNQIDLPPNDKLMEQLERFVAKESVDGTVFADLKDCLDDLRVWNTETETGTANYKTGKKKPKGKKKRGKRK
jgi:spermidine synthase